MSFNTLILWIVFFFYLAPLIFAGLVIVRVTTAIKRAELLLPSGSVLGLSLFVFLTNLLSFFTAPKEAAIVSFLLLVGIAFLLIYSKRLSIIDYPKNRTLIFCALSYLFWLGLIGWKGKYALIGSDANLYYGIAHTFIKGNFPPLTPWQPDIPLSYHIGSSQLLGSFHFFTNLSFEFLHIAFSVIFIFFFHRS